MNRRRIYQALLLVAVGAAGAGCYLALSSDESGPVHDPSARAAATDGVAEGAVGGETLSRTEWNARVTASKPIEQQPREVQRRYHQTWLAASQRSEHLQRSILARLEERRSSLGADPRDPTLATLQAHIDESKKRLAVQASRVERHRRALSDL